MGTDKRYSGERDLADPYGATTMGLIYVNPEGPEGKPNPAGAAKDIRVTFGRMAMNDEETVALIAGGHTFGKTHGAGPGTQLAQEPEGAPIENQGLGWTSAYKTGIAGDEIASGLEVTWTTKPTQWSNEYFDHLFKFEWELTQSPGGANSGNPKGTPAPTPSRRPHPNKKKQPAMLTTDVALLADPAYAKISRDLYPASREVRRRLRPHVVQADPPRHGSARPFCRARGPAEELIWQDPVPKVDHPLVDDKDVAALKAKVLASGLSVSELVSTAWASASPFRASDKRGSANGARIRLAPQKDWEADRPAPAGRRAEDA